MPDPDNLNPVGKAVKNIPKISNATHPFVTWTLSFSFNDLKLKEKLTLLLCVCLSHSKIHNLTFTIIPNFSHQLFLIEINLLVFNIFLNFPWRVTYRYSSAVSPQVTPWVIGNCVRILIGRSSSTFKALNDGFSEGVCTDNSRSWFVTVETR